ncbi:MAG: 3-phosphoserine/phosphohydroxythreonine transaminase [Peptococcaceae bacterium]|jgi:phosphoserine aminotransferase|nr:3-phosphoserine/phosphohydroxythreonine transaminase [Peptococcaceae bacterium]
MERVFNFNPGPATLPYEVLKQVQDELLDYAGTGMSVMEISHRSKDFEAVIAEAESLMKELIGGADQYRVLFLGGGASTQFAGVPLNLVTPGREADYIVTGSFAEKAYEEADKLIKANLAFTTKPEKHNRIPKKEEIQLSADPVYVHLCSNNTICGTQWQSFPDFNGIPLVVDMSSDMLARPFDISKFSVVYAGAQKNLGPSGVTIVIVRNDVLEQVNKQIPTMLRYDIHAKNDSMYNTPPCFSIYIVNLILRWLKQNGGLPAMEKRNQEKSALVYGAIDASAGFYRGHAVKEDRSLMNVTYRLPSEELEKSFVAEAKKQGLIGLGGHRSVGGIRASIYNAMTLAGCQTLAQFMQEFQRTNG